MRKIELLSPAKDVECGIAAINHGADAVYIGAQKFGARSAAGNSVADIERLVRYAHLYDANVYVTVNTILRDDELEDARKLIRQLYDIEVDALIVQDYSILRMDIPPIALHSSTQIDTRTVDKAVFLDNCGFSQIVMARELTLEQIRNIKSNVKAKLEAFVHGALCVSYSGQCYLSQELTGRSANRGECSQPCRMAYDLTDSKGNTIVKNKHLLSLKDMDRSHSLKEMIEAGISSFKIEGRLKGTAYTKNVTSYYRRIFDDILEHDNSLSKSSTGKIYLNFTPDVSKTFRRDGTEYILRGSKDDISSPLTPKSIGELIGTANNVGRNHFDIETDKTISNGDGLCFFSSSGDFMGIRANRVEDGRIFTDSSSDSLSTLRHLKPNFKLYRNFNIQFDKSLSADNSGCRKIPVSVSVKGADDKILISMTDIDGVKVEVELNDTFEVAKNSEMAIDNIKKNLSKTGSTAYEVTGFDISLQSVKFIPNSIISEKRKELTSLLDKRRIENHVRDFRKEENAEYPYPDKNIGHEGNVHNHLAKSFLEQHGASLIEPSFELQHRNDVSLMTCQHCIKRIIGLCSKNGHIANSDLKPYINDGNFTEPFYLSTASGVKLKLEFDCKNCEMKVYRS